MPVLRHLDDHGPALGDADRIDSRDPPEASILAENDLAPRDLVRVVVLGFKDRVGLLEQEERPPRPVHVRPFLRWVTTSLEDEGREAELARGEAGPAEEDPLDAASGVEDLNRQGDDEAVDDEVDGEGEWAAKENDKGEVRKGLFGSAKM